MASLGLHAVAFGGLGSGRTDGFGRPKAKPTTVVDFSVPKAKEVPPPAPPKPAEKAPRLAVAHPARVKARTPSAPPPPPLSAAPPPPTNRRLISPG